MMKLIEILKFPSKLRLLKNNLCNTNKFNISCKCPHCGSKLFISDLRDLCFNNNYKLSYSCPYCSAIGSTHSVIQLSNNQKEYVVDFVNHNSSTINYEILSRYYEIMRQTKMIPNYEVYEILCICKRMGWPVPEKIEQSEDYGVISDAIERHLLPVYVGQSWLFYDEKIDKFINDKITRVWEVQEYLISSILNVFHDKESNVVSLIFKNNHMIDIQLDEYGTIKSVKRKYQE